MRKKDTIRFWVLIIVCTAILLNGCTIKKISELDEKDGGEYSTWTKSGNVFEPVSYVDSMWTAKLIPAFKDESGDLNAVLEALAEDWETGIENYGLMSKAGGMGVAFKVKSEGRVISYDDSSRNGLLLIDIPPYEGEADISLQVGPVIRNTAIRDSLSFIRFSEIGNQLQFASLADELNARMRREVVDPLDLEAIEGKKISFYGAFKADEQAEVLSQLVITPVIIEILEESGE